MKTRKLWLTFNIGQQYQVCNRNNNAIVDYRMTWKKKEEVDRFIGHWLTWKILDNVRTHEEEDQKNWKEETEKREQLDEGPGK